MDTWKFGDPGRFLVPHQDLGPRASRRGPPGKEEAKLTWIDRCFKALGLFQCSMDFAEIDAAIHNIRRLIPARIQKSPETAPAEGIEKMHRCVMRLSESRLFHEKPPSPGIGKRIIENPVDSEGRPSRHESLIRKRQVNRIQRIGI